MRLFDEDRDNLHFDPARGNAVELSWVLGLQARSDRARFASLVHQMDHAINPLYFSAILDGLLGFTNLPDAQQAANDEVIRQFDVFRPQAAAMRKLFPYF